MPKDRRPAGSRSERPSGLNRKVLGVVLLLSGLAALFLWQSDSRSRGQSPQGPDSTRSSANAVVPGTEPDSEVFSHYAGSQSCRECHAAAFQKWSESDHSFAERKVRSDWEGDAVRYPLTRSSNGVPARLSLKEGIVEISLPDARHQADRVIGHDPLRQLLVQGPRGRLQAWEMAYDPVRRDWFNVFGNEGRQTGEWGHWTGRGLNWNSMCASCHNTRLRKNYDPLQDSYHTTMAEMSVGCEACHGPMKAHVEWRKSHPGLQTSDPTHRPIHRDLAFDTCGSCHARRAELTGDFRPGDRFSDHYALTLVDATDLYHADGQVRDENYEFGSFLGSRMHAAGVRCVDCHDPHSSKIKAPGDALCMQCHSGGNPAFPKTPRIDPATHTGHVPGSVGSSCVACHMPVTTFMQRHNRHDHGFTIPDPLLTRESGVPNACSKCHSDWDLDRVIAQADRIFGARMDRSTRQRTRVIAAARRSDPASKNQLLEILNGGKETPYWRGVAAQLVAAWTAETSVRQALMKSSADPDPLVRSAAVAVLEPWIQPDSPEAALMQRMLGDPVRAVRLRAAWALRRQLEPESIASRELNRFLAVNADQPGGQLQQAAFALDWGETTAALNFARRAAEWDSRSGAARHELAVVLSLAGRPAEAVEALKEAVRLEPGEGEYLYKLALAWNEAGDPSKAHQTLEEVVRRFPRHDRAWYNLGLSRQSRGDLEGGIQALLTAETVAPSDARIPYARATLHFRAGDIPAARQAVERVLELEPGHPEARDLSRQLGR